MTTSNTRRRGLDRRDLIKTDRFVTGFTVGTIK